MGWVRTKCLFPWVWIEVKKSKTLPKSEVDSHLYKLMAVGHFWSRSSAFEHLDPTLYLRIYILLLLGTYKGDDPFQLSKWLLWQTPGSLLKLRPNIASTGHLLLDPTNTLSLKRLILSLRVLKSNWKVWLLSRSQQIWRQLMSSNTFNPFHPTSLVISFHCLGLCHQYSRKL